MAKRKTMYLVTARAGTGQRVTRGRFNTKAEAKKKVAMLKKSKRTDADTKNPRIKKFKGYL